MIPETSSASDPAAALLAKTGLTEEALTAKMKEGELKVQTLVRNSQILAVERQPSASKASHHRTLAFSMAVPAVVMAPVFAPAAVVLGMGAVRQMRKAAPHAAEANRYTQQIAQNGRQVGQTEMVLQQGNEALQQFEAAKQQQVSTQQLRQPAFKPAGMG